MNTKISKYKLRISVFVPCLCCFVLLLFLRDFAQMNIAPIVFLGLAAIVALFADKTEIIAFCFCCIPMLNAFQSKYALYGCMVIYIIRFSKKLTIRRHILPIYFLVVWELIHSIVGDFAPVEIIRLFTELIFCCFILSREPDEFDFNKIIRSMSFVLAAVCCIILARQLKEANYRVDLMFSGVFRFGYGFDEEQISVGFNPNYLAYMCMCCIEGLVFLIYKKQTKVIGIILISVLSIFGLLTMSKKFILCAACFLLLVWIARKGKIKTLVITAIVLVIVLIVFQKYFPQAYEGLLLRFEESDLSTGRNDIFKFFNEKLLSEPKLLFFGVGLQDYKAKLLTLYNASIPHNGFQELLVMWGILGFIAFIMFLVLLVSRARALNPKIKFINYVPFIVMLINVQVSQMVSSSVVNMLLAVSYLCLITNVGNEKETVNVG